MHIFIMAVDVLLVGQPDEVPLQILHDGAVALLVLGFPEMPLPGLLVHGSSTGEGEEAEDGGTQGKYVLHL